MTSEKELMAASTSLLVLAALNAEPSYGYEIVKRLAQNAKDVFQWQEGTIYPVLHRLEHDGLVRAQWQDADSTRGLKGPRRRKYYYITAKGRRALADKTAQWNMFHSLVQKMTGVCHDQPTGKPALR